jgi:MFS family permease
MTAKGAATLEAPALTVQNALPGARTTLILLLAINIFNYVDRQVLAAVEPEIQQELLPNDDLANFKMGVLSTAFIVTYMVIAPLFGWLAERTSRWLLVGVGVILWSLASGGSGLQWPVPLAAAYWVLLATRCLVGVGEGAYGPVAPTLLSDLYPVRDRGKILAWFYAAIPVGGALGYAFGDVVIRMWGREAWRWAFFLVVPPGLLLGLLCFFMREPRRGAADCVSEPRKASRHDYLNLFRIPSFVLNTLGMSAMTFAIGGLAFWMPDYLEETVAKGKILRVQEGNQIVLLTSEKKELTVQVTPENVYQTEDQSEAFSRLRPGLEVGVRRATGLLGIPARTTFGIITALSGLIATLLGGIAGDRLRSRFPGSYFLVSGGAMLFGFPMMLLFLYTPFPLAWFFNFLAVFCLFFNTGPTNTVLANVTHPAVRASAFGLNILIIHALGDIISPPIIGLIKDISNLTRGFIVVSLFMLLGGLLWLWGARYLERDTALAPTRLTS